MAIARSERMKEKTVALKEAKKGATPNGSKADEHQLKYQNGVLMIPVKKNGVITHQPIHEIVELIPTKYIV